MPTYTPDPEISKLISEIESKREHWRLERQVHEPQWYTNSAFIRNNHYVEFSDRLQRLVPAKAPPHRVRLRINRMRSKVRMRRAKFLKNRPKPTVIPASTEYTDYQNAKATQKVLDYLWRRLRLELQYRKALNWSIEAGKGFWWYHWDPTKIARVAVQDPATGMKTYEDQQAGDIVIEAGSPFEVLVSDPAAPTLADQPEIMRVKMIEIEDARTRYTEFADFFEPTNSEHEAFRFERQISQLNSTTGIGAGMKKKDEQKYILQTELFTKPCGSYPKGRYAVLMGNVLVRAEEELPYGFFDLDNPYPVTEFSDTSSAGQFWCPTEAEQLIDIQKEYNLARSKLAEQLRVMAHPKLLVAKQHQIPKGAWTAEAGEIIEYVALPGLPPPQPWHPPNVAQDTWNTLEILQKEFDDLSIIYPASEGKVGTATSGFQTNLLQEAADTVHAPDIRLHELAIEDAAVKIRRMAKLGYNPPRLIAAVGANSTPDIFEFSSSQIDEFADVVVQSGSGLPELKAAKQDSVLNLYKEGMFGDPRDPAVQKRALALLEMGGIEAAFDRTRIDETQAELEHKQLEETGFIAPPHAYENHVEHYDAHVSKLKSPEIASWDDVKRRALIAHMLLHARFINPQSALMMALEEGITEVLPKIQQTLAAVAPQALPEAPRPSGEVSNE